MQEYTLDLLSRYFHAYNHKDLEELLQLVHDHLLHDVDTCRREIGKEAFARFLSAKQALYDEHIYDLEFLVNQEGTRAAAEYKVLGFSLTENVESSPAGEGGTYRVSAGTFFDIRDGLISRISCYGNRRDLWGQAA